jgi:DNA polymerase III delta prime subunit
MFAHTHKVISKLFNRYADNIEALRPINLLGPSGLGKLYYIKEFIRQIQCEKYKPFKVISGIYRQQCDCRICWNIVNDSAIDILIFKGDEKIEEVRSKLDRFIEAPAIEYEFKFLIVQNLQMFSNHELDIFLDIFEEPPDNIKVFTTSINLDGVSHPIKSRLQSFEIIPFSNESLKIILGGSSELETYLSILSKYNFRTIHQLIYYSKFNFESMFSKLFSKVDNSWGIDKELVEFFQVVEGQNEFQVNEVINFFMEFYIARMDEFFNLNVDKMKIVCLKQFVLDKLIPKFYPSLFKYLSVPTQPLINIKDQLFVFFNAIFIVKKIMGV